MNSSCSCCLWLLSRRCLHMSACWHTELVVTFNPSALRKPLLFSLERTVWSLTGEPGELRAMHEATERLLLDCESLSLSLSTSAAPLPVGCMDAMKFMGLRICCSACSRAKNACSQRLPDTSPRLSQWPRLPGMSREALRIKEQQYVVRWKHCMCWPHPAYQAEGQCHGSRMVAELILM